MIDHGVGTERAEQCHRPLLGLLHGHAIVPYQRTGRVLRTRPAHPVRSAGPFATACASPTINDACQTCVAVAAVREPARSCGHLMASIRSLLDAAAIEVSRSATSDHPLRGPGEILTDLLMRV
jgi:hypothetical protein